MASTTSNIIDTSKLDFDPDVLRAKYAQERDKRIRKEGLDQYQEPTGDFSGYIDDPYVESGFTRAPLSDEVEVAIIGGGFGGMLTAVRLKQAGVKDIRIIDKAGDFGGTWYWNRYPGAQCDVESYIYLPLLEELGYIPKEKYSYAPEILDHSLAIAKKYDLYDNACLQTEVTEIRWDESISRWIISTNRDDQIKAHFVAMANGLLTRPKLPGIPGIDDFKGHTFHTSRWDYNYTGGSAEGGLSNLKDKRVGIIGTGATAVQCIPHLGAGAKELYVFQRTPSSIDVRNNRPTDPEWAESLKPGWHQQRMDNFNIIATGGYQEEDLVGDGWTDIFRNLQTILAAGDGTEISSEEQELAMEIADFQKMEGVRARAANIVKDQGTAENLKPYYRQFCKRPGFHDEYLPTFNLPGVTLVDTLGQGVERVTQKGVIVNGKEYELDCLIFATGFEVGTNYTSQSGYDVIGRDDTALSEKWANNLSTFHGMHSHNFPNCYFVGFTQTGYTANVPHTLNEQAKHIAYVIKHGLDNNVVTMEASEQAEADWVATILGLAGQGEKFYAECTPGYYNNEGKGNGGNGFLAGQYGGGPVAFFKILDDWRAEGHLQGLEIT
ncbi:MAG: monooxygenase [Gammaproteobacteria bacterium]|nr:MAG: monooxygenase [Gammaproteobacteria bacterium]RLA52324.1 MAG: monooxygenase [Gammaproteobacteria bacterium]